MIQFTWHDDKGNSVYVKCPGGVVRLDIVPGDGGTPSQADAMRDGSFDPPAPEVVVEMDATKELAARVVRFFDGLQVPVRWRTAEDGIWFDFPKHAITPDAVDAIRGIMGPVPFSYTGRREGPPALGDTAGDSDGGEI